MRIKLLGRMCSRKRRINSWASRLIGAAIAMSIVPVAEAHTAVLGTYQAVVGDRHLVGVAAEVVEHLLGAGERALGIHHPVVRIEVAQETPPLPRFGQARLRTEARSTSIGTPSHRHRQRHRQRTPFIGPCGRARRGLNQPLLCATREDIDKVKYRGPFYVDFDGSTSDLDTVIGKVRQFIGQLEENEVDLDSISWYASGSRGFHAEIPAALFTPKPSKTGIAQLPQIYREMLHQVYIDTMDLRVYSSRKGRMWRTPNVERENGKFKVPVTAKEIREMTAEDYEELISAPRAWPEIAAPRLNNFLAVIYSKAEQKVSEGVKKRGSSQRDLNLLNRHGGDFPPTLLKLMSGEGVAENVGFQQLALQIGVTANRWARSWTRHLPRVRG
jgi:hypothetical protein